jgi:putative oxidoreductase
MGFLDKWQPQLLSVLRIVTGLLFLEHGTAKLLHFPQVAMFAGQLPPLMTGAGIIEIVGGVLVVVGFFSRFAAFVLSGEMAVGYFLVHAPQGVFPILNAGEGAILFCFVFLYIAAAGPGPWSINKQ